MRALGKLGKIAWVQWDEVQVTLQNLQTASGNLQVASTNLPAISEALGKETKDLPGLVLQTQTSMRELERLVEALQQHWFVRKYVNQTNRRHCGRCPQARKRKR